MDRLTEKRVYRHGTVIYTVGYVRREVDRYADWEGGYSKAVATPTGVEEIPT